MRTWTLDGIFICVDANPVAEMYLNEDEATFLVDAANAAELRKHLYGRVAEKVENLLSVYAAENHLKEPD